MGGKLIMFSVEEIEEMLSKYDNEENMSVAENKENRKIDKSNKYITFRFVVSGNTVEIYDYKNPINVEFDRDYEIERGTGVDENGELVKREDNLYRARKNVRQIVWANLTPHTKLLTLTYAEIMLDMKKFKHDFQMFLQSMKRQGHKLQYIYVLERQLERGKREGNEGTIHAHLVVFNDEKIPLRVIKKAWQHGRTEIHILNGLRFVGDDGKYSKKEAVENAGAYICKYISKDSELEWGSRCYNCSVGLKRPYEYKFYSYYMGYGQYAVDDSSGINQLMSMLNVKYEMQKHIKYETNDMKLIENVVGYKQCEIMPGSLDRVQGFIKTFSSNKPLNDEEYIKGKRL